MSSETQPALLTEVMLKASFEKKLREFVIEMAQDPRFEGLDSNQIPQILLRFMQDSTIQSGIAAHIEEQRRSE